MCALLICCLSQQPGHVTVKMQYTSIPPREHLLCQGHARLCGQRADSALPSQSSSNFTCKPTLPSKRQACAQTRFWAQVISFGSLELLEPARYPSFTLLGQAWGSLRLAWRALNTIRPEVSMLAD